MAIENTVRYSDKELAGFKELILDKIESAKHDLELIKSAYMNDHNLKNALIRVENKSYGVCRVTGKLINPKRLELVPHATLSIEAKNMQK